jgi:hypothetical protein
MVENDNVVVKHCKKVLLNVNFTVCGLAYNTQSLCVTYQERTEELHICSANTDPL